ncbi:30S ribosomal protein S24e, partial [Candidatus Bathyarchaeota archaeon]
MKIEIISQKRNNLLGREEVTFKISHEGEG